MKLSATVALLVCYLMLVVAHLYYPKWQQGGTEATLSYDVSGYYLYLPAVFIYDDLREVKFLPQIIEQYRPTATPYQAYPHANGNAVMKYSLGQAVLYTPAFLLAHAYASASDEYPADGFSRPYQLAISLWSLLISFLGLFVLMRVLLKYFTESTVALTLLLITLATNYFNYAAIDGALTHNYEFSLYALLILACTRLYQSGREGSAATAPWQLFAGIGLLIGLMALTRPTEIIACLLPLLWNMPPTRAGLQNRWSFLMHQPGKIALAVATCLLIGSMQLFYWKYVTGDWIEYSYQDQGFDWWEPHLVDGLFSYKAGWLTYTPVMWFALIGFIPLYRSRTKIFAATFLHSLLFIYVAFSWSVWWYGGSLGQRTMVQAYPILAFPLAATVEWVARGRRKWLTYLFGGICLILVAHNLWFTHQAHRGGLLVAEWMNRSYYWRTLFTFDVNEDDKLLLDNPEFFRRTPKQLDTLLTNDFENQSTKACNLPPISGQGSYCLIGQQQNTEEIWVHGPFAEGHWLRASADFQIDRTRGDVHSYTQLVLRFYRDGERVKERVIRLQRVLNHDFTRQVYIEARAPEGGADAASVMVWNGGIDQPAVLIDNLVVTTVE
ncbi:hypothetical protein [Neolewinella litorea]|uniref:Glycosyltransferase RgtA/B/C/D-like domain-containing protein n=1 Tax=Neolewinella litorea TaxID=2562452 RepID=A0A4S4NSU7_9BACT|nr:hypothetical protein [Neolewinella litorea]THH41541.1 hypothetical protein E4021_02810 [Neolewinella litorea]